MPFKAKVNWKEEIPFIQGFLDAGGCASNLSTHYGVSRQRIHQIMHKYFPAWKKSTTDLYKSQREKFNKKRTKAKQDGYEWTLEFSDVQWSTHCPILGIELDYYAESRKEESPSFDRIDSNKGYEKGNVLIISWRANRIKNDGTPDEHRKIANFLDKRTINGIVGQ